MSSLARATAFAATAALTFGAAAPAMATQGDTTTIDLVAVTDFHGHIQPYTDRRNPDNNEGGAIGLACAVKAARDANPSTLFVSAGDNVGGSAYISSILQDQPTIDVLNAIGLDVSAAGNHEFDRGIADYTDRILPALNAPMLAANIGGNTALSAEGDGKGSVVKDVNGVRVGFVGVVTDELPTLVSPQSIAGLTINNATETANKRAAELKDGDPSNGEADVVVVLAHEDAEAYGRQFSQDVDAVIGGHTHVPYAQVVTGKDGNTIAVSQPDNYGTLVGKVSLTITEQANGTKKVTAQTAANESTVNHPGCDDAYGVAAIVSKAEQDSKVAGDRVVAQLGSDFLRGSMQSEGTLQAPGSNRGTESTASNLIADSFAWWVKNKLPIEGEHFVGLMNAGGVRADYPAGGLTYGNAYTVQPFGNELGYTVISGAQFKQALAQQWQPGTSRNVLTLGVSANVQVVVNQAVANISEAYRSDSAEPAPSNEGLIREVLVDGKPLADDARVVVATNTFILGGGDAYSALKSDYTSTGTIDLEATSEYLASFTEAVSADYAKRQIGVSLTGDPSDTVGSAAFTGLSFSNASEQGSGKAAQSVRAVVTMADGSSKVIAEQAVDKTVVTGGLPETGRTTVNFTIPAGTEAHDCTIDGITSTCTTVSFEVVAADGSTRVLPVTAEHRAFVDTTPGPNEPTPGPKDPSTPDQPNKPEQPDNGGNGDNSGKGDGNGSDTNSDKSGSADQTKGSQDSGKASAQKAAKATKAAKGSLARTGATILAALGAAVLVVGGLGAFILSRRGKELTSEE